MQFFYDRSGAQYVTIQFPFPQNIIYIGKFQFVPFGDALVATTKGAKALTKRKVYVNADSFPRAFLKCPKDTGSPLFFRKAVQVPIRNCWVTGVSGAGNVVFLN